MGAVKSHLGGASSRWPPTPGTPFAYFTTRKFLETFGFATLCDLPAIERLEIEGRLKADKTDFDLGTVFMTEATAPAPRAEREV